MRPLTIKLWDFMSYHEEEIDLSGISLASIVGANGTGKSTILQAITYCLWGKVKTRSHNDVVRRGSSKCAVRMEFMSGGKRYMVTRRRKLSGKGSTDLELASWNGDAYVPWTALVIKETQRAIDEILGMGYDVFASSSLLQQGDASRFSSARPGERKELLAEMLNLGFLQELERRARQREAEIEQEIVLLQASIQSATQTIAGMPVAEESTNLLEHKIALRQTETGRKREHLAVLRADHKAVSELTAERDKLAERGKAYTTRIQELEAEIERLGTEAESLFHWPSQQNDIIGRLNQLRGKARELDGLHEIAEKATVLATVVESLGDREEFLRQARVGERAFEEDIDETHQEIARLQGIEDSLGDRWKEIADTLSEQSRLVASLEGEHKAIRESRDLLETHEICPTCNQVVEDRDGLLADLEQALSDSERRIFDLRTRVSELEEERSETMSAVKVAEQETRGAHTHLARLETTLASTRSTIDETEQKITVRKDAERQLEELSFDREAYDTLVEEVRELPDASKQHAEMQAGLKRLDDIDAEIEKHNRSLSDGRELLSDLVKETLRLESEIAQFDTAEHLETEITETESSLAKDLSSLTELEAKLATIKERQRQKEELHRQIEQAASDLELKEADKYIANLLVKATSKTGAQALLIEAALPQIEKDTNEYLGIMSPGVEIRLNTQRMTLAGSASETLDIVVYTGGQEAPLETLSGGERFRADLALRLAIGKMLSRRSGTRIEMLAIDEGFGSQDDDGQEVVVDSILSLAGLFDLILVISHIKAVAEAVGMNGATIETSKVGGVSRLEIIV